MAVDSARYSDLCRLCATKTNMILAINIFENQAKNRQIFKKIEACLPVQIHETDELPKMICENCLYKLELLFEFRERSVRTESLLVDLFKELNAMQLHVDQQLKLSVAHFEPSDLVMVQHLNEQDMQHVSDIDLSQLTHRESMMVGHEIILTHQNVSLDHIELSNHALNQELSNQSMVVDDAHLPNGRYDYPEHHILTEQYSLSDINLTENNLQAPDSIKDNHHLIEEHTAKTESQEPIAIQTETPQLPQLKQEDSNSENKLLINENNLLQAAKIENVEMQTRIVMSEKDLFFCMCGKSFGDKDIFQQHYDTHFNKCEVCLAVFVNRDALNSHRKEAHGNSSVNVPQTDSTQNTLEPEKESSDCDGNIDLEGEAEDDEFDDQPAENAGKKRKWSPKVCKECGKVYKTNYKLTEHMRKHTGEQPFKCKTCDRGFRSKIGLAQHEAKHTGQYDYACLTCGKGFQCKSYLMVHQRVHSDLKPYPCTTCGRNFKTKQSLLDHTNRHLGVKPYTCETCGRSFITNGLCKAHQKVHSGTDNRKYSCKVCNKMFVSKSYLQTHSRIHTGEKPFMCEVCGKGFLTRVDLKIHSTMHTGEKSYVCEMCGKAFARRDALRCHRRSHTGERPYSCDICGQTFTQFSPMAIHKRLHTGERPYECETCGKKFVSRSTMMVHSKKHIR